jgi:uncharacterized protein (TIGR03435 family)
MKRALLSAAVFIFAAALHAQPAAPAIAGNWQGTLPVAATAQGTTAGSGMRLVFNIVKDPHGALHGTVTPIDQGSSAVGFSITFSPPNITFTLGDAPVYHGRLSADGQSIAGTWAQGNQSVPLTISLANEDTLWTRKGPSLPPMAANADPAFEVATIKPALPAEQHALFDLKARKFNGTGLTATELIKIAWNIRGRQVIGGPPWLNDTRYDVVAEPDTPGQPSEAQVRAMIHKLLTERFHLAAHTGQQDFPALALTLDSKGPAPTPSDPGLNGGGGMIQRRDGDDIVLQFNGTTIHDFLAWVMNNYQDKALVDETGLTGIYNITLRIPISSIQPTPNGPPPDDPGNALVLAAGRAGFKFTSKKAPLPVVIVDHIDPPTPN